MYSEKFCLQWNDHSKILVSLLEEFLGKESLLDVTLAAEGHLIRVHRLILCACSPYFEAMLNNDNGKQAIVFMKDVKYEDLKALVDFMYKGEVTVVQEQLASFMSAAEALQIKGLVNKESHNSSPELQHSKLPKTKNMTKSYPSPSKSSADTEKSAKKSNGIPSEITSPAKILNRPIPPTTEISASESSDLSVGPNIPIPTPRSDYISEPQSINPTPSDSDLHFIAVEAKMETDAEEDDPDNIHVEPHENEWPFREATDDWANSSNANSISVPFTEPAPTPIIQSSHSLIDAEKDNQAGPSSDNSCNQVTLSPADSEALLMANPPGSKSFTCRLCSYHTDRKFNLKLHLRRKHKMAI